jgi:protein TonB
MFQASHPRSGYGQGPSLRRRAVSFLLALSATALILVTMVNMGIIGPLPRETGMRVISIQLAPQPKAQKKAVASSAPATHHAVRPPAKPPVPPLNMVIISREDFLASDIAELPSHPALAAANADTGAGNDTPTAGQGPNGETLYAAEWYVEPTHAQMAPYLPANGPEAGWAMIACRTIAHYHVDDCTELGEGPPGSGLSRALRGAAWQFLVRPPRIGGKTMVGDWVRIRFDFTRTEEK